MPHAMLDATASLAERPLGLAACCNANVLHPVTQPTGFQHCAIECGEQNVNLHSPSNHNISHTKHLLPAWLMCLLGTWVTLLRAPHAMHTQTPPQRQLLQQRA